MRAKAGILFQESALFDSLTVRDNVAYPLLNQRVADRNRRKLIRKMSNGEFVKRSALWNWNRRSTSFRVSCQEV